MSGESQHILVKDFQNIQLLSDTSLPEILDKLKESDQRKANTTFKLMIRGKLGRTVPVLVPQNVKRFLDYVYECRNEAKVPESNSYLFGLPGQLSGKRSRTLKTCVLMKKYSEIAEVKNPFSLRTTVCYYSFNI